MNDLLKIILQSMANFMSIYNMLIIIYILSSWVPSLRYSRIMQMIGSIVEPYLSLFKSLPLAQAGMFMLYPIYGLVFLKLLQQMITTLLNGGNPAMHDVLNLLVGQIGGVIVGLFHIMGWATIIRFVVAWVKPAANNLFLGVLDMIILPGSRFIGQTFFRGRIVSYRMLLLWTAIYYFACALMLEVVIRGLIKVIAMLVPF
jgi:YggT family protein